MATGTTVRQRQEEQRKEKLREIRRQIKDGSLVVRKMTKKERAEAERRFKRRSKLHPRVCRSRPEALVALQGEPAVGRHRQ